MEQYLLCGEERCSVPVGDHVFKGRRRGTIQFVGVWKHEKTRKEQVSNGVMLRHALQHRNVVQFLEWYETPQHVWVITELANGGTLADILAQDGCIATNQIAGFTQDISRGLEHIHSENIVYCDLQPCKIILDSYQNLKLCDFTLARSLLNREHSPIPSPSELLSATRMLLLDVTTETQPLTTPSPFYTAPELVEGRAGFSEASDLWSFGCLVFELATGHRLFERGTAEEVLAAIRQATVEGPCSQLNSGVAAFTLALLQRAPHKRTIPTALNTELA